MGELIEKTKERDLIIYVLFNYCDKSAMSHLGEIKKRITESNETGNVLLARILALFEKWLPEVEYEIAAKDLITVARTTKKRGPVIDLSQFVSGKPSWNEWTKEDDVMLMNAKRFAANHFSFLIVDALLGKEL